MSQADPARNRFIALQLIRASGAAFALFGLLIIARSIDLPIAAGYILLGVGLFDVLIMPSILVRRWKSPPQ